MAGITYYVVLPFVKTDEGELVAEDGIEASSSYAAIFRARALLKTKAGAIAFSRTGDPSIGEFSDPVILGRFGETMTDFDVQG